MVSTLFNKSDVCKFAVSDLCCDSCIGNKEASDTMVILSSYHFCCSHTFLIVSDLLKSSEMLYHENVRKWL